MKRGAKAVFAGLFSVDVGTNREALKPMFLAAIEPGASFSSASRVASSIL